MKTGIKDTLISIKNMAARPMTMVIIFIVTASFLVVHNVRNSPENLIIGEWREDQWSYEKFDGFLPRNERRIDGINVRNYSKREVVRHEFESWLFTRNDLYILKDDSVMAKAKWKLKGRGHILKIKYEDGAFELYDIKELTDEQLVLNYDIGMEVRGIAKLEFKR